MSTPSNGGILLGIIPARGGSKRIPRKNIINLGGQPLIKYTIDAACSSNRLSRFIVSTDNLEIADVARNAGASVPFLRPPELATDLVNSIPVMQHAIDFIEQDGCYVHAVVLLQPTSPFRDGTHIDAAIDLFTASDTDSLTSVCRLKEHPYYAWKGNEHNIEPFFSYDEQALPRQGLPPAYIENGAIYITKRGLIDQGRFYGNRVVPFVMDEWHSVDIDTPLDLLWAEFLLKKRVHAVEEKNTGNNG